MKHQPTHPVEVPPEIPNPVLPEANWADAFEMETGKTFTDMKSLADQVIGSMPAWAKRLLTVRNLLVAPFGLKTGGAGDVPDASQRIGIFPILEETKDRIVLGLDDKHLDFRIIMDRSKKDEATCVRTTTLVTRHNLFGQAYIALVTPFHRLIVRSVLVRAL